MATRSNQDSSHHTLQLSAQITINADTTNTSRNTSIAVSQPSLNDPAKKQKRNRLRGKRKRNEISTEEPTKEIHSHPPRPTRRPKNRKYSVRERVIPAPASEVPRFDPDEFWTQFSDQRRIAAPPLLAGGFLITAKSQNDSIIYATNVYNPESPQKEFVVWTDASWLVWKPQQLACIAQTFVQNPGSTIWSDMITLVRGPKNAPFKLFGIRQAMDLALQQFPQTAGQDTVKIFTDSQMSMEMILNEQSRKYDSDTERILQSIGELARDLIFSTGCRLEIHWVKSHSGVPGNERADFLAGEGRFAFVRHGSDKPPEFLEYDILKLQDPEQKSILTGRIPTDGFGLGAALERFASTYKFSGRRLS